jgi:DNA-binding transcriptional MerR regulator
VYQAQEFAALAGVTVRTLHHYDRIGLLKPAHRTMAAYRLYSDKELRRLEQIVVLKFLGLSLQQIRKVLDHGPRILTKVLREQRQGLEARRHQIDRAVRAITAAERSLKAGIGSDTQIIEIIRSIADMEQTKDAIMQYYSPSARAKIKARNWPPEMQAQCERDWAALLEEVRTAMKAGEDPGSPRVQALAARWKELVEGFTGGDPEIMEGLKKLYADRANWPSDLAQKLQVDTSTFSYIAKAGRASESR